MQKSVLFSVSILLVAIASLFFVKNPGVEESKAEPNKPASNLNGKTVLTRFSPPEGYKRINNAPESFARYLQQLPLKPNGTPALTYKGDTAGTEPYTAAIIDMSIGEQNLQQCADAVMRLRGEYLYRQKNYAAISFNFSSGFKCDFLHYADGYRYQNEQWVLRAKKDYSYQSFLNYMTLVFSYAGTLSLQKEMHPVTVNQLQPGDIFIKGGSPGHCFIVMDAVTDAKNNKKFLLAQSYMPAQNIQIVQMFANPWFSATESAGIPYGNLIKEEYLRRF